MTTMPHIFPRIQYLQHFDTESQTYRNKISKVHHNIMLIDDDPDFIYTMRRFFNRMGNSDGVLIVDDAQDALDLSANTLFSLFIVDVNLIGTDGFHLIQQIRDLVGLSTPTLFISSDHRMERTMNSFFGPNERNLRFLPKPFPVNILQDNIAYMLRNW